MIFVLLSVCCSVIVSIIIKVAKQKGINVQQSVLWNYPVTVLLTFLLLRPDLSHLSLQSLPFLLYIPLSILLPTLFIVIALAIQYSGIVKTDIAQRLSLFIPLLASFLIFDEQIQMNKGIGVMVGLLAVICSISWNKAGEGNRSKSINYPLIVFLGIGLIDVLFKQIAQHKEVSYISSMFFVFVMSMIVAFVVLGFMVFKQKKILDRRAILWGGGIGVFNFGNIYLYMNAHRALPENPSLVFTAMNIGVIVLGGIVGICFFNEKLSIINKIGLVLAIVSVLLITYL